MTFIEKMKMQAKQDIKTIVLPESEDIRTLEATEIVLKEGFANIILIGNPQEINDLATKNNINLDGAQIVNPATSADFSKYANDLYELRKNKGMTLDQAKELLKTNSRYFATMMVKEGDADGFVSGASHPTSDTLRPALQILKAAPGTKLVSAFFVMVLPDKEFGDDGVFIFADSGLNEYPDADALSEIAISSSKSFKELIGDEPKVAMLSYSTHGSAHSPLTDKVIEATKLLQEKAPDLIWDGEIQLDYSSKRQRCNWKMLPPGEMPSRHIKKQLGERGEKIDTYDIFRLEYMEKYNSEKIVEGINGFKGYYAFIFSKCCVLESAIYGNATYIIPKENWEILSQKTKKELFDENKVIGKIDHTAKWKQNVSDKFKMLEVVLSK